MKYLILLIPAILFGQAPIDTTQLVQRDSVYFTLKVEIRYDTTEVYMIIPVYRQHLQWGGRWKDVCQLELVKGTRIRKTDNFSLGYKDKFYYKKKEIFPLFSFTKQWMKDNNIRLYEE